MEYLFSDIVDIRNGRNQRAVEDENGKYPIYGSGGIMGYATKYLCDQTAVIIGRKGSINHPIYVEEPFWNVDTAFALVPNTSLILAKYLFYFCVNYNFERLSTTVTIPSLTKANLLKIKIDVPDLAVQQEIVKILNKLDSLIMARKHQIDEFNIIAQSRFVELFGDVNDKGIYPIKKLGDCAEVKSSHRVFTKDFVARGVPFYRGTEISKLAKGIVPVNSYFISKELYESLASDESKPQIGDLLMPSICDRGQIWLVNTSKPFYYKDGRVLCISPNPNYFNSKYLQYYMKLLTINEYVKLGSGSTFAEFKIFQLKNMTVSIPPMSLQNQFADFVQQLDKSKYRGLRSLVSMEELYHLL